LVFENSTACVYVETGRLRPFGQDENLSPLLREWDFEHKLKVKRLSAFGPAIIFTESLILAQDERWRRA
jgi:hypothetical protein